MGLADKCENRRLKEGTGQSWWLANCFGAYLGERRNGWQYFDEKGRSLHFLTQVEPVVERIKAVIKKMFWVVCCRIKNYYVRLSFLSECHWKYSSVCCDGLLFCLGWEGKGSQLLPSPLIERMHIKYKHIEEHHRKQKELTYNPYFKSSTAVVLLSFILFVFLISLR